LKQLFSFRRSLGGFDFVLFESVGFWLSKWDWSTAHQCVDVGFVIRTNEQEGERVKHCVRFKKLIGKSKLEIEEDKCSRIYT